MRYAIISDIHGNLQALEVVLEDMRRNKPDRIICLGDLVGYGANPNEVIVLVREVADLVVAGNHDHAAVGMSNLWAFNQMAYRAAIWTQENLPPEHTQYLKSLPYSKQDGDLFFVHASPMFPEQWFYIFSRSDAESAMSHAPAAIAFVGHTHIPMDHQTSNGRLINVGSVGQPRDGDPRAAYTLFNSETGERKLIRLEYDYEKAGSAIKEAGLPEFLAERLKLGR